MSRFIRVQEKDQINSWWRGEIHRWLREQRSTWWQLPAVHLWGPQITWGARHSQAWVAGSRQDFSGDSKVKAHWVALEFMKNLKIQAGHQHMVHWIEARHFGFSYWAKCTVTLWFLLASVPCSGKGDLGEESGLTGTPTSRMDASSELITGIIIYLAVSGYT